MHVHVCQRSHTASATHQHCLAWIQPRKIGIAVSLVLACTMTQRKQLIHRHVLLIPRRQILHSHHAPLPLIRRHNDKALRPTALCLLQRHGISEGRPANATMAINFLHLLSCSRVRMV